MSLPVCGILLCQPQQNRTNITKNNAETKQILKPRKQNTWGDTVPILTLILMCDINRPIKHSSDQITPILEKTAPILAELNHGLLTCYVRASTHWLPLALPTQHAS